MEDNYAKVAEKWRQDFVTWDHEAMCKKLGIGTYDAEAIRMDYFGIPHRIDRRTGKISCPGRQGYEPVFDEAMAIYNLFYYAKEGAKNSGDWIHLRNVRGAGVFEAAFEKQVLIPFANHFSGKTEEFKAVGKKMGFFPLIYGDASFQIAAFFCIPLRVIFWDGDEEFPAKVNILFDRNITDFTHPESVVMLGMECMRYFVEESPYLIKR